MYVQHTQAFLRLQINRLETTARKDEGKYEGCSQATSGLYDQAIMAAIRLIAAHPQPTAQTPGA